MRHNNKTVEDTQLQNTALQSQINALIRHEELLVGLSEQYFNQAEQIHEQIKSLSESMVKI